MFIKSTKMKLSINKAIKNNFKFFLLAYTLLYFCLINLKIFEDYWDEKIFWEHRAGNWTAYSGFSTSDFFKYSILTINDFTPFYLAGTRIGIFYIMILVLLFVFYIINPIIFCFFAKKNKNIYLLNDLIFLILYTCVLIFFLSIFFPLSVGLIPLYIFFPINFIVLTTFRIYQYKKNLIC
ncbi:hypothetical protein Q787_09960 [Ornithobacterium rhinotracheale H06-030791]|uniref:Uncharacterized protein n=2 Tax=Ornithobacterium rhinotracheale TaxID=28251 RepID=I4A2J8_ORNRL|nr:hypothetical protein Ornrh_2049 [Ornithobacterium rhinotracheale DSM 15997]AIQ00702.1 hypothetical protein Q785_10130 [Ornithobacterium rhinotracheale ORT-UMN 88]KGB66363.1 hypothetical protein Q787_09960 [Ornithobacterium rhinotracheale H06-030791]